MSLLEDQIKEANAKHKETVSNCAIEHLEFLEKERIATEKFTQNSVKANWERLREKRFPKVLRRLPLSQ